ncbi:MAG: glycosyltransferase family 4 protein [Actinobacteria bacterium]|nr:glycosyltransferase family 4 protein [Actinomycetota bacterium]
MGSATGSRVLHVVSRVMRRGPEIFAAQLAEALPAVDGSRNLLFPLFGPAESAPAGRVHVVPGARPPGRVQRTGGVDVGAVARLRAGLRRLRPDLLVAHGAQALAYAELSDPRGRVPLVYRQSGHSLGKRSERWLVRLLGRPAVVIATNEDLRQELGGTFGAGLERVRAIPPARREPPPLDEVERAALRSAIGAKPDLPLVTWIGRLSDWRRPGLALQAFALAEARFGPCHLAMCGDGPLRHAVERAASAVGESALVLGSRDDAERILSASDVLLSTAAGPGQLGVLVQAGLAGIPAVAFDTGQVGTVVRDGETGELAPPGFLEALTVVLVDLLRNPDRRRVMGEAAREACRPFRLEAVLPAYAEAFAAARGTAR